MALSLDEDDQLSDDEIFFGKLSLKEFKKHTLWNTRQSQTCDAIRPEDDSHNESLKIIETHSEPNLRSRKDLSDPASEPICDERNSDESFLKMESLVSELCLSPRNKETSEELNNTLEVIEYILNNGPTHSINDKAVTVNEKVFTDKLPSTSSQQLESKLDKLHPLTLQTPNKEVDKIVLNDSPNYYTPVKSDRPQPDNFVTPSVNIKAKTPIFKTPGNVISNKKSSAALKKTPNKTNAYQHISSPVASYIRNCPQVPLLKDVHPKKPLPGPSSIPKFMRNPSQSKIISNKENVNLPLIAYRTAKTTKVIDLPDEEKLPQSEWVKKITSTLPRPVIMKHNHREINFAKKKLLPQQEDSFADLSYHQADISVCTQKTAFKPNRRF